MAIMLTLFDLSPYAFENDISGDSNGGPGSTAFDIGKRPFGSSYGGGFDIGKRPFGGSYGDGFKYWKKAVWWLLWKRF